MIIAGTGHRPQHCTSSRVAAFSELQSQLMRQAARMSLEHLAKKYGGIDAVIAGGALGWDTELAFAAHELAIPIRIYIPCKNQDKPWSDGQKARYAEMLAIAAEARFISNQSYSPKAMQDRNIAMVNDATVMLALFNGTNGGTANCINYAKSQKKPISNAWRLYQSLIS